MIKALPSEILLNVFSFIPYTNTPEIRKRKDLATCRLVCKQWSALAERTMFDLPLCVRNEEKFINKLLYHLTRKPALARLIKKITLSMFFICNILECEELLEVIITPAIEEIQGLEVVDDIYQVLLQIMKTTQGLKKLKRLPEPDRHSEVYLKAAYACKDTLVDMTIGNRDNNGKFYLQHLHEFRQLKRVKLCLHNMADVRAIDQLLQKLVCINQIEGWIRLGQNYVVKSEQEMSRWLAQNVEKDENLRWLEFSDTSLEAYDCNLLEYFMYKYPKLETLSMKDISGFNDHSRSPLEIIKDLPVVQMKDGHCYSPEDLYMVGLSLKSRTNTIKMFYAKDVSEDCKVALTKRMDTSHTDFKIELLPESVDFYLEPILSIVRTGDSDVIGLDINLVNYTAQKGNLTLYDILEWAPHVHQLHFTDARIKYKEQPPGTLVLNDLKTLIFYGAEIQNTVFTQIGNAAPNLEELKLSTCITSGAVDHYYINMPQNTLKELEISELAFGNVECIDKDYFDQLNMQEIRTLSHYFNIARDVYLLISIGQSSEDQYFLLPWKGKDKILIATKEEFDLHSPDAKVVQIACKALSQLKLNTPHFDVHLRWKDGKLENEASYPVSEFLNLEQKNSALKDLLASKEQSSPTVD